MKLSKWFLGVSLVAGVISVTGCNDDNDSSTSISGDNSNVSGESLSYINFKSEYNDISKSLSVFKEELTIAANKVTSKYTPIVDSGLELRDELTTSFILANNFTYEEKIYIDNFKLDPSISNIISKVNSSSIELSYKSKNGNILNFKDPYTRVNISNQPLSTDSDNVGVRIENLTKGNQGSLEDFKALRFPVGSECIVFEGTTGNYPYYEFELEDFDSASNKVVPNTVGNFKNLEDLLADQSFYEPSAKDAAIENVGINNTIRAVHFPDADNDYEYAYVEYQGKVYYASYNEERDLGDNENTNPNTSSIFCDGYNQVAANFLETQYVRYLK